MKIEIKFHRRHIIALCLAAVLAVLYVLAYNEINNSKKDKQIAEGLSAFSLNCGRVETIFDVEQKFMSMLSKSEIFNDFLMFYINDDELKYSSIPDFENDGHVDDEVSRVKDGQLRLLLDSQLFLSKYTNDIAVSRLYDGYTITRTKNTNLDDYLAEYGLVAENIEKAFGERSTDYGRYEIFPIPEYSGQVLIVGDISMGANRSAYIFMCLDLKGYLNQFSEKDDIMAVTHGHNAVASNVNLTKEDYDKISSMLKNYETEINMSESGTIYDRRDNLSFFVRKSKYFDEYNYVYIISKNNNIGLMILIHSILILILFVIVLKVSALIDQYLYMPIDRIRKLFNTNDGTPVKLNYMADEISNVMITNKNLKKLIYENSITLKDKFIIDCTKGIVRDSYIEKYVSQNELSKYNDKSVCVIFTCQVQNLVETITNDEWIKIKDVILCEIKRQIGNEGELVDSDFFEFLFITNCDNVQSLAKELSTLLVNIEIKYEISIFAAISDYFYGFKHLQTAFSQASYAKDIKQFSDGGYCILYGNIKYKSNNAVRYPINIEKNLIDAVLNNNIESARLILSNVLQENVLNKDLIYFDVNEFIFAITATIKRIIAQLNKDENEVFGENAIIYLELKMCDTKHELAEKIKDIFEKIFVLLEATNKTKGEKTGDAILAYIDENFMKDISLTTICEAFSLSVSHVSFILKEYKNVNFKSYLTQKRIDCAKEIMRENKQIKISEIYKMIGYTNAGTFIRQFKQAEGISPGEFQKSL